MNRPNVPSVANAKISDSIAGRVAFFDDNKPLPNQAIQKSEPLLLKNIRDIKAQSDAVQKEYSNAQTEIQKLRKEIHDLKTAKDELTIKFDKLRAVVDTNASWLESLLMHMGIIGK